MNSRSSRVQDRLQHIFKCTQNLKHKKVLEVEESQFRWRNCIAQLTLTQSTQSSRLCPWRWNWTPRWSKTMELNLFMCIRVNLAFSCSSLSALLVNLAFAGGDAGVTRRDLSLPRALAPSECVNVLWLWPEVVMSWVEHGTWSARSRSWMSGEESSSSSRDKGPGKSRPRPLIEHGAAEIVVTTGTVIEADLVLQQAESSNVDETDPPTLNTLPLRWSLPLRLLLWW